MAEILIKNMEMPKDCSLCPFALLENGGRNFFCLRQIGKRFDIKLCEQRQEGCPLVELPTPHGDLIDRKKAVENFKGGCWEELYAFLSNTPTVIPSSEKTNNECK